MASNTVSAATDRAYRLFAPSQLPGVTGRPGSPGAADDFDESDIWGSSNPTALDGSSADLLRVNPISVARPVQKKPLGRPGAGAAHGSLPVNIPDWSKILGNEYRGHHTGEWELEDDDDIDAAGGAVIPPHELAWRGRAALLSVHEGIGRTLKGRDLSRVRDAVWKKTGFED